MLALGYVGYPVYQLADAVGFQPLTLWPVLLFVWLGGQIFKESCSGRP
jgi:hypothetical protein